MQPSLDPQACPRPRWPWVVAILLGLTQPAVHLYIQHCPPPGAVHSGMSIPDSAIFLQAMEMFQGGLYSPYAHHSYQAQGISLYPVAHLWLYGLLGLMADLLRIDHFLFLGIANGAAFAFYLCMVWRFLVAVVPGVASPAFALFTLSGGPGGLLWLIATLAGWQQSPGFDEWSFRWVVYSVTEGPYFHPMLIGPRAYYTLSLGIFLGALAAMYRGKHLHWLPLVVLASFLYARAGVFSAAIAGMLLWHTPHSLWRMLYPYGLAVAAGAWGSTVLLRMNPAVVENHLQYTNQAMWISAALVALALHLPAICGGVRISMATMSPLQQRLALGCIGYLSLYVLIYLGRGFYFGTLWQGSDGAVAASVSDFALPGLLLAAAPLPGRSKQFTHGAIALWALLFSALAISGFGQGWFLQWGPQRLQLFLWLPLCVLAAVGMSRWKQRTQRAMWVLLIGAGVASVAVTLVVFQAGAGRSGAKGPLPRLFAQWISVGEAKALEDLENKTVFALPPLADAAVRLTGAKCPWGTGAFNMSKQPWSVLNSDAAEFFDAATTDAVRRMTAVSYGADYILIAGGDRVQPELLQQLDSAAWLRPEEFEGGVVRYRVLLN